MIFLGIGSSLKSKFGDRFANIKKTINLISAENTTIKKISSYYETPSYPDKKNPKFINVVIQVESTLPPVDLVSVLLFIEIKLGRRRVKKNDPRTCDIDVIDYNSKVLDFK